jgi:DNA topoisomerase III
MSKALIIAEKPSVAADIARALGGFTKQQDFFESDDYVVSSAVGHLLEIGARAVRRQARQMELRPSAGDSAALRPAADRKGRGAPEGAGAADQAQGRDALINACDAGREGELIFRYIAQHTNAKQPIRRLWLQSMTPAAIREGSRSCVPTPRCAAGRRRALPLRGRLAGRHQRHAGDDRVQQQGRRLLPDHRRPGADAHAGDRGRPRGAHPQVRPRDYWEVRASFGAAAGTYEGRWFDPAFRKPADDEHARAERLWDKAKAEAIVAACRGKTGTVTEEAKPSSQSSPLLFDLTSLQREGNGRFGFSAKTTLSIAQALYEKHKVLTYPRTDSRALPEDYVAVAKKTVESLGGMREYGRLPRRSPRTAGSSRTSGSSTTPRCRTTSRSSRRWKRPSTCPRPSRRSTTWWSSASWRSSSGGRVHGDHPHHHRADAPVQDRGQGAGRARLAGDLRQGSAGGAGHAGQGDAGRKREDRGGRRRRLATKPPARYNEGTLLSAMEGAGKLVDDEDLRAAMAGKGLGTPATRAAIIEGLINEKYLIRDGKDLHPTAKAFQLLTLLRGLGVAELTAPELTGEWEHKLAQMERGKLKRDSFMQEIAQMTEKMVERAKSYESDRPCPATMRR